MPRWPERMPKTAIERRRFVRICNKVGSRRYDVHRMKNLWRRAVRAVPATETLR